MKLSDRISELKSQVASSPEGRSKGIKLAAVGGLLTLAFIVVVVRLFGPATDKADRNITPQVSAEIEKMAEELEAATEEEADAFEAAVASGEVEEPTPIEKSVRTHPKGVGYTPGFDPSQYHEPAPAPAPEPAEPEEPESEDPG